MQQELEHASEDAGHNLMLTAPESAALDVAADCVDQIADLQDLYRIERSAQSRPAMLASEIGGQQNALLAALGKIQLDGEHISRVRRAAVRQRWGVGGVRNA